METQAAETFDIEKAKAAQSEYCRKKEAPHFAPYSGICYRCGKNIYEKQKSPYGENRYTGISVEKAGSQLVTGCPHCNISFCD